MLIYAVSLNGAVAYWDTGEAQTVPWIFGIMHPTGFPAFTLIGGIFAHLIPLGAVSWRMALFSAVCMSTAAWLVWRIIVNLGGDAWLAVVAAWLFAFGEVAWTRGTRAEVHSLALMFALAAVAYALRWYRTQDARTLALGALCWALAIATHPIAAMLAPAFTILLVARLATLELRAFLLAVLAFGCGMSLYAYLPIRSVMVTNLRADPSRAIGMPPGGAFWDMNHPAGRRGFVREVTGEQFSTTAAFAAMFDPHTYTENGSAFLSALLSELTPVAIVFALGGLYALWRSDWCAGLALLLAAIVPAAFALAYSIEADPQRYDLIPFAITAVFAGYAASAAARALPQLRRIAGLLLLAMVAVLLVEGRSNFAQPRDRGAQAVIRTIVEKTPRNAILVAPWLYATPIAYAAYVEHALGQRVLVCAWLADVNKRVPNWTRSRPVYVVGILFGDVRGYKPVKMPGSPDLYKIVKTR